MTDWTSLGVGLVKRQKAGPWILSAGICAALQEMMFLICPFLLHAAACAEKNMGERRDERSVKY